MSGLERVKMVEVLEYDDHGRRVATVLQTERNLNRQGLARMIGFHPDFSGQTMTMHLEPVRSKAAIRRQGSNNYIMRDPNNNIVDFGSCKRKPQETRDDWGCQLVYLEFSRRDWATEVWSSEGMERAHRTQNWQPWQRDVDDLNEQIRALIKGRWNLTTERPHRLRLSVENDDDMVHVKLLPTI